MGEITYMQSEDAYNLTQTILETGETSSQIVKCQDGKKYTIPYVVYEKTWSCSHYPPNEEVKFTNIKIECDNEDCTKSVEWAAKVKDSNCEMTAHIDNPEQIRITWNTGADSKYDSLTPQELLLLNKAEKTSYAKSNKMKFVGY